MKLSFLGRGQSGDSSNAAFGRTPRSSNHDGPKGKPSESSLAFFHNLYKYAFVQRKNMVRLRKSVVDNDLREIETTKFKHQLGFMSYSPSNRVGSSTHSLLVATSNGNKNNNSSRSPSPFTFQDNMTSTATYDGTETVISTSTTPTYQVVAGTTQTHPKMSHLSNSIKEADGITVLSSSYTVNESLFHLHRQQQWNKEVTKRSIELERFESIQAESFKEKVGFMSYSPSVRMSMSPAKRKSVESGESFQQSLYTHDLDWKEAVDKKREEIRQSIAKEKAVDDDLNCTYQPKLQTEIHNSNRLNVTVHSSRDDCLIEKHSIKDVHAYKMAQLRAKYEREYNERFTFTPNKEKREKELRKRGNSTANDAKSVFEKLYQQPLKKSTAAQNIEPNPDFTFKPKVSHVVPATVHLDKGEQFERLHRSSISNVSSAYTATDNQEKKVITKDRESEMLDRLTRRDIARRHSSLESRKKVVAEQLDAMLNTSKKAAPNNDKLLNGRRRERLSEIYYVLLMSVLLNKYNNGLLPATDGEDSQNKIDFLIKKLSVADELDLFFVITELLEPPSLGEAIKCVVNDKSTFNNDGKNRMMLTLDKFTNLAMRVIASGNGKELDAILLFRSPKRHTVKMTSEEMEYQEHFTGRPDVPKGRNEHRKAAHGGLVDYLIAHRDHVEEKVSIRREQLDREKHEDCSFEPIFYSKSSYR